MKHTFMKPKQSLAGEPLPFVLLAFAIAGAIGIVRIYMALMFLIISRIFRA